MKYKIELPQHGMISYTKDADKLKVAIVECFNSKTEIDVYDEDGDHVGAVWNMGAIDGWNYFYTL